MKYAFIGSGNMARAIIAGLVRTGTSGGEIAVINPNNAASTAAVREQYGTEVGAPESLLTAEVIVLAVKPQTFPDALPLYREHINRNALIVSIMAGISLSALESALPGMRIIRVMPNLNLSVGKGAAGYALGSAATAEDGESVRDMFSAGGTAYEVTEDKIDDVAALSGSGSAYIYYLIEALRDVGTEDGLAPETADALARQTLIGAAALLEHTGEAPEELRARITSKKGTTEAAILAMGELGFQAAVKAGYRANKRRSAELARGE